MNCSEIVINPINNNKIYTNKIIALAIFFLQRFLQKQVD